MPKVSIVTTVYDRIICLRMCLRSVQRSAFTDYEQIVVSDAPPAPIAKQIGHMVAASGGRVRHINLSTRRKDWGITPAAVGLRASVGEYVCFLSDDNAFLPNHLTPLVTLLDEDPSLGFVYSSCQYANQRILRLSTPEFAYIDLGQLLFRREVLRAHFHDELPFTVHAWDWELVQTLMNQGVKWRHLDETSFIFRVTAYQEHVRALA